MVTSILAGNTVGVAPGVNVYYFETNLKNKKRVIDIIKTIIQLNRTLEQKIKVISISLQFRMSEEMKENNEAWDKINKAARNNGILIISTDNLCGIRCPIDKDKNNLTNYRISYWFENTGMDYTNQMLVPTDNRTCASSSGKTNYIFTARGGNSFGAPFLAGVIALGYQVNPVLTPEEIDKYLWETAIPYQHGGIINPVKFIEAVKAKNH